MKSPQVLITLSLLLLAVGWSVWDRVHTSLPTETWDRVRTFSPTETESAFLKNYTPTNVLNRFNDGQASYGSGSGAAFGHDSVTHKADFNGDFALCSEKFMPLMDALSDDIAARLVGNGARILSQIGDARAGFHFDYKLGKTVGSVTIAPLELTPLDPTSVLGHSRPVPNCMVGVHTSIKVAEKWFAKDPGLTQVSVNNSIQQSMCRKPIPGIGWSRSSHAQYHSSSSAEHTSVVIRFFAFSSARAAIGNEDSMGLGTSL